MAASTPAEIMAVMRREWSENVSVTGSEETSSEAPVLVAFRRAKDLLHRRVETDVKTAVSSAMRETSEWTEAHRDNIRCLYDTLTGRQPTRDEIDAVWNARDQDELVTQIMERDVDGIDDTEDMRTSDDDDTGCKKQVDIDEDWMDTFRDAYGREPSVYEYVRLRNISGLDLMACASAHRDCFGAMRDVHKQYFDRVLEEHDFVKQYVPEALTAGDDLVRLERERALSTPEYREAMLHRLSHLYAIMSGEHLSEEETAFLFSQSVKGKKLPLDTEQLNDIVVEYVHAGEELRQKIHDIYHTYLERDAHNEEMDTWLPGFRMRQGSHDALKRHLSTSHEFHAVLTERIAEACPGLTRRDKYRALDEILESRSKQLANADDASTVSDIVTGHLQP